ncbi:MAG TPA: hypothetical protein VEZ89_04610 [Rubrivivax sp.]|nr:hypothetical protein [Rubrivivax sp.]
MMTSPEEHLAVQAAADPHSELVRPLQAVEDSLTALGLALHHRDSKAVDNVAAELHAALTAAVDHFSRAAKTGGVPPPLRRRLALASGQVAAQREALARATASLDRAMEVLIPRRPAPASALYSAAGSADRSSLSGGSLLA